MKFRSITVDKVNGNGRFYPREVVEKAIKDYSEEFVNHNRAFGEMGQGQTDVVDLTRVSHQILGFSWDKDTLLVEVKVLHKTPQGMILSHLIEAGKVTISMSPRGLATVAKDYRLDAYVVGDDYKITTFDAIDTPLA